MAKLFVVVYRTGGTHLFEWRRTVSFVGRESAEKCRAELERQGYRAHVEDYHRSMAVGLPETFEPGQEVK
jgi:hypothetical protein